ncbi:HEAT repeat domain-containing protein [Leptolyngbya ohadii]|uniref:HEAT repeat domain-containing protein n=1 Tax=Leptolyngbya ohadii TaxID=1962290 RepID=UPI000B59D8A5|nr:HEAT repeat domain-containing protein [Leptolyngbya ohadii]
MQKKILVLVSNPEGTTSLNLPLELKKLQEAVERSKQRDYFTVVIKFAATKTDLRRHILDERPQIIHFCGHASQQGLWLDNLGGKVELASNEFLTNLLRPFADRIECVVLNACDSEHLANDLGQHLNYAIGMNREVRDDAAIEFAEAFYDALGAGETYELAFELGSNAMRDIAAFRRSDTRKAEVDQQGQPVAAQNLEHLIPVIKVNPNPRHIKSLWLSPEVERDAVRELLKAIESGFNTIRLFHTREEVVLADQYIPVQVTLERRYQHSVETIGGYAESEAELRRIYAMKGMGEEEIKRQQVDWQEARKQESRIVVLADPGMGKSTLLRREVGITIQQAYQSLEQDRPLDETIVPFLIRLSTLADEIDVMTIEEAILKVMQERHSNLLKHHEKPEVMTFLNGFLKRQLLGGKGLLLLDALDEVPNEKRLKLLEKLNLFANDYPNCPIVGTSRIVGYGGRLVDGAKDMEIVPFSQRETEEYIRKWFKNAQDTIQDKQAKAQGLIQALRERPQLAGLAQNPLLLSLICSLFQHDHLTFPARRSQIYEEAVTYMLQGWHGDNRRQRPQDGQVLGKIKLLEKLAYQLSCKESQVFSASELRQEIEDYLRPRNPTNLDERVNQLINELSEQDGILQKLNPSERNPRRHQYIFLHRTFQEYFTASYLNQEIESDRLTGIQLVKQYFWNYDWHESLILIAGLMEKPMLLIEAIATQKDDIFKTQLLLAGQCLAECGELSNARVDEIIDQIYEFWLAYPDAEFIRSVLIAVGQVYEEVVEKLSQALNHKERNVRLEAVKALRRVGTNKALDALMLTLENRDSYIRNGVLDALEKNGTSKAIGLLISLLKDENSYVRGMAAEKLGQIRDNRAVEPLISVLNDEDGYVRRTALAALGKIGNDNATELLISALKDQDSNTRRAATRALAQIGSNKAIAALISALEDQDGSVRFNAAEALGQIGSEQVTYPLISALQDKDSSVRLSAAEALGQTGNSKAIKPLISALNDRDSHVRRRALGALERICSGKNITHLVLALENKDSHVRRATVQALGRIGSDRALNALISALQDKDSSVRRIAVEVLGRVRGSKALDVLISALQDKDSSVRRIAVEELEKINSNKVTDELVPMLKDKDIDVRLSAAKVLGKTGNKEAIDTLISELQHKDYRIRKRVTLLLRQIDANSRVIDALISALSDEGIDVRSSALSALAEINDDKVADAFISMPKNGLWFESINFRSKLSRTVKMFCNDRIVDFAISLLKNGDDHERSLAVGILSRSQSSRAIDALISVLKDQDRRLRVKAAVVLGRHCNEEAIDVLILALRSRDEEIAEVLNEIDNIICLERSLQLLQPALIYRSDIFLLLRSWAIRFRKVSSSHIPAYPELIRKSETVDSMEE